jgi:hypothetical protein
MEPLLELCGLLMIGFAPLGLLQKIRRDILNQITEELLHPLNFAAC